MENLKQLYSLRVREYILLSIVINMFILFFSFKLMRIPLLLIAIHNYYITTLLSPIVS